MLVKVSRRGPSVQKCDEFVFHLFKLDPPCAHRYSREAYLELIDHVQSVIPGVALSSDFIAGFCGETEADHEDTMSPPQAGQVQLCLPLRLQYEKREYNFT